MKKLSESLKSFCLDTESLFLTILFMGLTSTLFGALWLSCINDEIIKNGIIGMSGSVSQGVKELTFNAILHIALAFAVKISKKADNGRK